MINTSIFVAHAPCTLETRSRISWSIRNSILVFQFMTFQLNDQMFHTSIISVVHARCTLETRSRISSSIYIIYNSLSFNLIYLITRSQIFFHICGVFKIFLENKFFQLNLLLTTLVNLSTQICLITRFQS